MKLMSKTEITDNSVKHVIDNLIASNSKSKALLSTMYKGYASNGMAIIFEVYEK